MKECFKCGALKPLNDFYKHARMADGHVNKCKECNKKDVRENRSKNVDYYREYDCWRYGTNPDRARRNSEYAKTDAGKAAIKKAISNYQSRNPEARAAHVILGNAVRRGDIEKPKHCPVCLEFKPSRQIHAHHDDYSKPLQVRWMCAMCHAKEHGRENKY